MKKLLALAAFLLASSTAQAQYQFEYGGRTIKIDPDRGTVSIPGVYDNTGKKHKGAKTDQKQPPAAPAPAPSAPAVATQQPPPPPAPAQAPLPEQPATTTANNAPPDNNTLPPPPPPAPPPLPTTSA